MKFEKRDEVKYIGHLDTMRTFTRCIKKTNLPIKFSSGFNPRVQLAFALPLAVGVTSECEYFDLELNGDVDTKEVINELNKSFPDGFKILTCEKFEKVKGLMSLVTEATYEINLMISTDRIKEYVSCINDAFSKDEIIANKNSKDGKEESINIKPLILDYNVKDLNYNTIVLSVHCLAGSKNNLNPNYLIQIIKSIIPEEELDDYNIHRKYLKID
jgi:radical SAM-linked protein